MNRDTTMEATLLEQLSHLSDEDLSEFVGAVTREYSVRVQRRAEEGTEIPAPISTSGQAAATDVLIIVRNMLRVFEIAPFELSFL